jgi:hypothetical protein
MKLNIQCDTITSINRCKEKNWKLHYTEIYMRRKDKSPHIPNLGIKWSQVLSLMLEPMCPWESSPLHLVSLRASLDVVARSISAPVTNQTLLDQCIASTMQLTYSKLHLDGITI